MKSKTKFKYLPEHLEFLRIEYRSMTVEDLTIAFNQRFSLKKTVTGIKSALKNHKILCGRSHGERLINRIRLFSPEQVQFLRDKYAGKSVAELAVIFNAKFEMNLTLQQIRTAVKNRGIISGCTGRFEKGHNPWNKGKNGYIGANRTSFKKGNIPANWKPIGSERICLRDGYVYVKIAERDPYTGFSTRYKLKHVYLWEQIHGPVPNGHALIFCDGDKLNVDPDNLMIVSRAELLRLNKHGYKDAPENIKPSILALAKMEVKMFEVQKMRRLK